MGTVARFFGNFAISSAWLWLFQKLGWITFAQGDLIQYIVGAALLSAIVAFVVGWAYIFLSAATCGFGCLLYPIYAVVFGWCILVILSKLTGWFDINVGFWWQGLLMSIAYGVIRIPPEVKISTE